MAYSNQSALHLFVDRLAGRSSLDEEEKQAILDLPGVPIQVPANRDFVRMGDHIDHACLIVEGLVGRFGQSRDGNRQITSFHITGDMADLHTVVVPHAASALQALSTCTILKVPHRALRDVAARYPAVAEAFWRDCVVDAAILSQWVVNVGRRDAKTRTAHLLCEMAARYEEIGYAVGLNFPLPATQSQLADALGLTPVHVNRTLKALKAANTATMTRGTVQVLDWEALTQVGEFDPVYLQIAPAEEQSDHAASRQRPPRLYAFPINGRKGQQPRQMSG